MDKPKKLAVITGGTGGLGSALSLEFAEAGYQVLATYHANQAAAADLEKIAAKKDYALRTVKLDVCESAPDWEPAKEWSEIILVNNAVAPFHPKPLHLLTAQDFAMQWRVSVQGAFLAMQSLYRYPKPAPHRTVINVLSEAVSTGPRLRGAVPYVLAKQALLNLSVSWAQEQLDPGLRIFCVAPSFMETSLTQDWPQTLKANLLKSGEHSPAAIAKKIRGLAENKNLIGNGEIISSF